MTLFTMGVYTIFRMFKRNLWIYVFLIASLICGASAGPSKMREKDNNGTGWEIPQYDYSINKKDLAIGLSCGFVLLVLILIIAVLYLKKSKPSSNGESNIYMILPNGQTVPVQKQGPNVTVSSQNDIYALGGIGGAPLLPPRVVDDDDTYAKIVDAIYSATSADKVLSIPMDERNASASTGSHYVRGLMGPAHLNPAYGTFHSPSLLNVEYGDPRMLVEYRSHDGLSFAGSTGEEGSIRQVSQGNSSQPSSPDHKSPKTARTISENEGISPDQLADEGNDQNDQAPAVDKGHATYSPLPAAPVHGAYAPLPGPLLLRPVLDRGHVSYVLDGETGYRSRVVPQGPDQSIYVRDPESGHRTRVLAPGGVAPQISYIYNPESGVRMRAPSVQGGGPGGRIGEVQASPSGAAAAAASANNANEQSHSGDSHDSQSSTTSGASSSTPLASASVPLDLRPSAPRLGYAAVNAEAAAAALEVADVPTVIRRYNADTGEEYIYTLAVSRLPRTNANR